MNEYNQLIKQHRLYPVYENIKGVLFENWMEPLLNIDILDDSLCLEWWKDDRKLTIYIGDKDELNLYYLKVYPGALNIEDAVLSKEELHKLIPIYNWLLTGEEENESCSL